MELTSNSDIITRQYFDSLLLESRYLDSVLPDTKMELFGHTFDTPVMTAALSHLDNTAKNGMVIYAEGAKKSNALHFVGMGSDEELERIIATGAKTVKIIKPHADNNEVLKKIEHAVSKGCFAVGMDIDHSFSGSGEYDNVLGLPMKSKTTEELKGFVEAAKVPFIVKGVLSPIDAKKCLKAGAAAIIVSHHHGILPSSVPPLKMVPEILKAVGNKIPVFIDCGIESGLDVYKCLAMGATAVSVGRHLMPLLKKGSDAVSERINQMNAELKGIMAKTGIKDLKSMDPTVIHPMILF